MATTKNLHLMLTARSQADEALAKTGKGLDDLKKKSDALKKSGGLSDMLGAAAGGLSIGMLANSLSQTANRMLDQADAAKRSGASIEGYSGLMFAAGRNADALAPIIDKLSVSIGQANNGSEDMVKSFRALGLESDALAKMTTDQAFLKVVGALNQQENAYARNAKAAKVMGEEVKKLMPMMLQGEQALRDKLASGKGVVGEREVAEIKKADQAVRDLSERWEKFKRIQAIGWAHIINDLTGKTDMDAAMENARKSKLTPIQAAAEKFGIREPKKNAEPFRPFAVSDPVFGATPPNWWEEINAHMQKQNRIRAEAGAVMEANQSPLDRLKQRYEEINRVFLQGGLAADIYDRAVANLVNEFDNLAVAAAVPSVLPAIQEQGSGAAISTLNRWRAESERSTPNLTVQERMAKLLEQLKTDNAASAREARKVREAVENIGRKLGIL